MIDRRSLLSVVSGLVVLILVSCAPPIPTDRPSISSIRSDPEIAEKGGTVLHTIEYGNASEEQSFSDIVVVVRYSEYLDFDQNASPFPDDIDERERELSWRLGKLDPSDKGSMEVEFRLKLDIPIAVWKLEITAEISSADAQGSHKRTGRTLIEGHPTPTPKPTRTPTPTPQ